MPDAGDMSDARGLLPIHLSIQLSPSSISIYSFFFSLLRLQNPEEEDLRDSRIVPISKLPNIPFPGYQVE